MLGDRRDSSTPLIDVIDVIDEHKECLAHHSIEVLTIRLRWSDSGMVSRMHHDLRRPFYSASMVSIQAEGNLKHAHGMERLTNGVVTLRNAPDCSCFYTNVACIKTPDVMQ
jgi:hypothetical protein